VTISSDPPPTELGPCDLYVQKHRYAQSQVLKTPQLPRLPSWWPFQTYEDFEQTDILIDNETPILGINRQLAFIRDRFQQEDGPLTLKNADEMVKTLKRASFDEDELVSKRNIWMQTNLSSVY
jgi:hypothetical protein